jgi:RimJ/RimL family protein N-acetyltransferase
VSPRPIEFPVEGLSDGVVLLRLPADEDVDTIVRICRDPAVQRYTTVPPDYKPKHAREWVRRGLAGASAGTDLHMVIVPVGEREVVGTISLHELNRAAGRCASGYFVAPWARGRGYATRALLLACAFAFDQLDLHRVEVTIEPENEASRRVALAAGFTEEGLLRSYMPVAGRRRDMVMYSLLRSELRR